MNHVHADGNMTVDMAPVDLLSHGIIISTAEAGREKGVFKAYHVGSSHTNRITSGNYF